MTLPKSVREEIHRFAVTQYLGEAGCSLECRDAIIRLLQYGDTITRAEILTHGGSHAATNRG